MIIIISIIILVIILYILINVLYNKYLNDLAEIERHSNDLQKQISKLEEKEMINEKLINWLYDEINKKMINKKDKKEGKKNEK